MITISRNETVVSVRLEGKDEWFESNFYNEGATDNEKLSEVINMIIDKFYTLKDDSNK